MKRLLIILLALAGLGTGGHYLAYGRLPWVDPSPEEVQVAGLQTELGELRRQWKQAGRAAVFGADTSTITDTPLARVQRLEGALAELEGRLTSPRARDQAARLRQELETFKAGMR